MTPEAFEFELQKRIQATWKTDVLLRPLPSKLACELYREVTQCHHCDGTGKASGISIFYSSPCDHCNGTGSRLR